MRRIIPKLRFDILQNLMGSISSKQHEMEILQNLAYGSNIFQKTWNGHLKPFQFNKKKLYMSILYNCKLRDSLPSLNIPPHRKIRFQINSLENATSLEPIGTCLNFCGTYSLREPKTTSASRSLMELARILCCSMATPNEILQKNQFPSNLSALAWAFEEPTACVRRTGIQFLGTYWKLLETYSALSSLP